MIHLDGVSVPKVEWDYLDFVPFDHQAAADELIRTEDAFFAVNESPTGSGKTYSWLKPAMDEGIDTIAVYPTNALITDQVATAKELRDEYYPDRKIGIKETTGETIAEWRSELGRSKGEALAHTIEKSFTQNDTTLVFTNPDILTTVRKQMYSHRFVTNKFNRFGMVVLDEFHLADVKQRDSLLFLIDEMDELADHYSNTNRFYFSSATPEGDDSHGRSLFARLREDIRVDPVSLSAKARPLTIVATDEGWQPVMPPVNLELRAGQTFKTADTLLDEDIIEEFAAFCDGGKTVVMLDGVTEVDRVYDELSDRLNSSVKRITGFHRGDVAEKLERFDVLVSNSAVEVGLDFQPERLVFSAHNAATLVQRLGRLRERDDRSQPYVAWCYVPAPVRARITAELLETDESDRISRTQFERTANDAFTDECDLSSFSRRWGELEAYQHVVERKNDVPPDAREEVFEEGLARIRRHYYEPYGREFGEEDLRRLHKWTDYDLLEELKSYRGSGLQVMVRDHLADEMKLYDMFHLLRWGRVEFKSPIQFRADLNEAQRRYYDAYSRYAVGFCEYRGKIPMDTSNEEEYPGRSVSLHAESPALYVMKNASDAQRTPEVVDGITVSVDKGIAPPARGVDYLREEMSGAKRLCYVVPGNPSTVEATYGLDEFFFLYTLGEDSIALGTNALYIHCLVQDRVESQERDWGW